MNQFIKLVFIVFLVVSCAPKSREMNADVTTLSKLEKKDESTRTLEKAEKTKVEKKKIIKDGRLGLKVTDLGKSKIKVDTLVRNFGGYYDNESYNNTDSETAYDLKIRIPSDKFEAFVAKLENGDGVVSYKEITARDVTDEFIDLEIRLANKHNYLSRYQELLKKAKTVKEILEIEEKIRGLEEELESTIGRLKYLNDEVDYSTLTVNISQKKDFTYTPEQRIKFTEKLKQSVSNGWFGFVDFLLFLLSNWAFVIIISVLVYFWIKYRKRKKNKKNSI